MVKNLVTNADIRAIQKKFDLLGKLLPQEARLLFEASRSESQIQIACHNLIKDKFENNVLFIQIDNGGKMGIGQKMKKKAEGTQSGFCDVIITCWKKHQESRYNSHNTKTIYVEFKKIGGVIAENQQKWHEFLKEKGESVHYCNNLVYFERVIIKEIEQFLNGTN
jgi:hypothetical protein